MKRLFAAIGFCGPEDLLASLFRPSQSPYILLFSAMVSGAEFAFGLKPFMLGAFMALLVVELASGLVAARLKKRVISSRRMQRFGIMVLIWLTLLMVANALVYQYEGQAEESIAHYIHTTLLFYIISVYMKSIFENAQNIWDNKINAKEIINQLFKKA